MKPTKKAYTIPMTPKANFITSLCSAARSRGNRCRMNTWMSTAAPATTSTTATNSSHAGKLLTSQRVTRHAPVFGDHRPERLDSKCPRRDSGPLRQEFARRAYRIPGHPAIRQSYGVGVIAGAVITIDAQEDVVIRRPENPLMTRQFTPRGTVAGIAG
ncbi:hypothetical protein ORI20_02625 [Mycobacterium sp. CVI_P3]|uniref:Uncharacterized protein n=1 Tax=Mycobacterium pinniadriaticum TaxID=2994102 RepID=A0ABT3S7V6_9MYCO|nr:hypothetical protein [Mycobacterium pinniadriaticum]MCX2929154.1 hypothetical protein [Mycobacterium pinniadriaticum]MCX2935579.1 hypothetical protein [Mycobacterium pinniadriaticum]